MKEEYSKEENQMSISEAIAYANVALHNLIECEVPVTQATMFYEMNALIYEYTGKEILKKARKI